MSHYDGVLLYFLVTFIIFFIGMRVFADDLKQPHKDTGVGIFLTGMCWPLCLAFIIMIGSGALIEEGIKRLHKIEVFK